MLVILVHFQFYNRRLCLGEHMSMTGFLRAFFGFKQCRLSVESFLKYFKHCLTVSVVKG